MDSERRPRHSIGTVLGLLMAGLLWTVAPTARADTIGTDANGCSYGDALAVFNAFAAVYLHDPVSGGNYPDCQYRMWDRGEHFTFQEDEWFLAAGAYAYDYQAAGVTRAEAIAELDKYGDRLWLTKLLPGTNKATRAPVEQPLTMTAYMDAAHPEDGLLVIRQTGVILHLPPGEYLSYNEVSYEGNVVWRAKVILHILPSS